MNRREEIEKLSLVHPDNLNLILALLKRTEHLPGINAEVGVYRGGTALLIAANSDKAFFAFDTFEGLPVTSASDIHVKGEFSASYESVSALFVEYGSRVKLVKGIFPGNGAALIHFEKFAFAYLDVDLYHSTKDCLEFFYPRMVPGGILVSDDYGWKNTPGVTKAIDEFLVDKPEKLYGGHVAYIIKK